MIVRGVGWQMDTLPAPFLKTNKDPNGNARIQSMDATANGETSIVP